MTHDMTKQQIENQIKILRQAVMNPVACFRDGERDEIWAEIQRYKDMLKNDPQNFINLDTLRDAKFYEREDKQGIKFTEYEEEPCFFCGRGIREGNQKLYVHYLTDGRITNLDSQILPDLSQGYFPVGGRCIKKVPKDFLTDIGKEWKLHKV